MYNFALSFIFIGAKINHQFIDTNDIYTFHIYGKIYYRIGILLSDPETQPQFAQIYIYNIDYKIQNRSNVIPDFDSTILIKFQ